MKDKIFEKIVGYEEIKLELARILDGITNPEKYAALGVEEPHGVLLYGRPGVGKSTLAQCFMDASGRKTFICRKDKPDGEFVKEIVKIFDEAAKEAPSVILLDDMDKFANEDECRRDAEEFVTVQACIDRVKDKRVFVIATANNINKLPASLTRVGRFDSLLELREPKGKDAQEIVAYYLSKKSFVADMDVKRISRLLEGNSCAELETVINQAGAYAAFSGRDKVEMQDMIKAILRVIFGAPEKICVDEEIIPIIACHEAGHALVSELLEPDSVDLVTVLTHNSAIAGITSIHKEENKYFLSKKLMENRVKCLLAGKAATEICYGAVDTGAMSDLKRVFDIVHRFVDDYCSFGFDKFVFSNAASNDLLARRDAQVSAEIERYYSETRRIIIENRAKLDMLIERLVNKKTLLGDEVQEILKSA